MPWTTPWMAKRARSGPAEPDVMVIDIMLPKRDGLSLIKQLREQKVNTPALILSAKDSVDDRVKGLETGADDYLTKPFAFSELVARVQALIRRASGISDPTRLTVADLSVNLLTREVVRDGKNLVLQPLEFSLLEYLMTPCRKDRLQNDDHGTRVGLPFRSPDQCGGSQNQQAEG